MLVATFSELRARVTQYFDKIEQDRDKLVVTRKGCEPMVVMPLKDWEKLKETLCRLGNVADAPAVVAADRQATEPSKS